MEQTIGETQVLETMKEALEIFDVSPEDVRSDASFEALGLDSLDLVELSVKIEDAYDIELGGEDLEGIETVGDAVRVVLEKVSARA